MYRSRIIRELIFSEYLNINHLERSRYRRLQVNTHDTDGARSILTKKGYTVTTTKGEFLEVSGMEAISHPENVASLLVHKGHPPAMLKVEEEDLESYFFRVIGKNGGMK